LTLLPWESILKLKGVYKNTLYFCNLFWCSMSPLLLALNHDYFVLF
jgi:hypothetical protein